MTLVDRYTFGDREQTSLRPDERHFADADVQPDVLPLWFCDHGISIFPTVNKVPAVPKGTSWKDYRCPREQAARFREYGVPLGSLAVADSDSPPAEAWSAANLPQTPLIVTTGPYHDGSPGHGRHRYYRLAGDAPHFIHRDGYTIEFKHAGQYVVGPGSRRPDGVIYTANAWSWVFAEIPVFPVADFVWDDRPLAARGPVAGDRYEFPAAVHAGERHDQLFRLLRSCKARDWDREMTREIVSLANQDRCQPPLDEDEQFERWFTRAWQQADRPFTPPAAPVLSRLGLRRLSWR